MKFNFRELLISEFKSDFLFIIKYSRDGFTKEELYKKYKEGREDLKNGVRYDFLDEDDYLHTSEDARIKNMHARNVIFRVVRKIMKPSDNCYTRVMGYIFNSADILEKVLEKYYDSESETVYERIFHNEDCDEGIKEVLGNIACYLYEECLETAFTEFIDSGDFDKANNEAKENYEKWRVERDKRKSQEVKKQSESLSIRHQRRLRY